VARAIAIVLLVCAAPGCKTQSEKEEAAWNDQFAALEKQYRALHQDGPPELATELVKGRKALIVSRLYGSDGPRVDEARTRDEVGIVVVWSVARDATPSKTYEHGIKGYGGQVEVVGFAHPEGKRLARSTWHCSPPSTVMRFVNVQTGAPSDSWDEHCLPSDTSLREFAAALQKGRAPEGSNAGDETKKAFEAIGAAYQPKIDLPPGAPVDLHGRKLLLFSSDDGGALALYHNEYLLPAAAYADSAREVGVVGVARTRHELRPSVHYSNGAEGYDGRAELVLFAHPEGRVVSRTPVPCHLSSEDIVVNVLASTKPQRCSGEGDAIRAAVERALGPATSPGPAK
jgi:hypothetical protein